MDWKSQNSTQHKEWCLLMTIVSCDACLKLQLYNKTCEVAKAIAALQADLYIIHTPHGIGLSDAYAVYGNTHAAGNARWMGQWSEFEVEISCRFTMCKV